MRQRTARPVRGGTVHRPLINAASEWLQAFGQSGRSFRIADVNSLDDRFTSD